MTQPQTSTQSDQPMLEWYSFLALMVCGFLIILANIPVFIIAPKVPLLQGISSMVMVAVAVTDSILGLVMISVGFASFIVWEPNYTLCSIIAFFGPSLSCISVHVLTFFNLGKFLTLAYPLQLLNFMPQRRTIIIIVSIWIVNWTFYLLPILEVGNLTIKPLIGKSLLCVPDFHAELIFSITALIMGLVLPGLVTLISALGIFHIARKQNRSIGKDHSNNWMNHSVRRKSNIYILKTVLLMTSVFYIMYGPYFLFTFGYEMVAGHSLFPILDFGFILIALLNSLVNPLLYILSITPYKQKLYSLFFPCCKCES